MPSMMNLVQLIVAIVVVLAVLSAMWTTIDGFIDELVANETGAVAALAPLIKVFIIIAIVLAIIFAAMKYARE